MGDEHRIQDLRAVHEALTGELTKIYQLKPGAELGFGEGEYDTSDLWGRLTALGQLITGLEGRSANAGPSEIGLAVALRAVWECFWELDKLLCGRGLGFAGRQGLLEQVSGLVDIKGRTGASVIGIDAYIAKLAE